MKKGLLIIGLTPLFCILLVLFGGSYHQPPAPPIPPVQVDPTIPPQKPKPGSQVEWFDFQSLNNNSNMAWGKVLTDIKNHLPSSDHTHFPDKNTDAHESTHGIHAHLNNTQNQPGDRSYYHLYPGNNKAVKIKQPNVRITDIAKMIPESMRKTRYHLYLVQQSHSWDKEPIYLWDEWVAYCNGAECGIELINKGVYKPGKNDSGWSVLEFSVYATYVAIAQKQYDPSYDNKQLLEFLAWNLERSMDLYENGQKLDDYNWDNNQYLQYLRTSSDASEFRNFLINTYGTEWTNRVFGFKK